MKRIFLLLAALAFCLTVTAQPSNAAPQAKDSSVDPVHEIGLHRNTMV